MNLNLIAYGLFLAITIYIIVVVGQICYRNGTTYVLSLVPGHQELCTRINRILLTGYYLVNLGYTATTLTHWQRIETLDGFVEVLANRTGFIIILLAVLHYINLFIITRYIKKIIH
jgi:hypothetical protein